MSGAQMSGVVIQDPEDVFEFPAAYDGVDALDRGRCRRDEVPQSDCEGFRMLFASRKRTARANQPTIDAAMTARGAGPALADLMKGVDFGDPAAMTPLQAAIAETVLDRNEHFGGGLTIGVWNHVQGVPFTLEAFVEYCRFQLWPGFKWSEKTPADTMQVAEALREKATDGFARSLTTFLFAERTDWLQADLAAAQRGEIPAGSLLPLVATAEQAAVVGELLRRGPSGPGKATPPSSRPTSGSPASRRCPSCSPGTTASGTRM